MIQTNPVHILTPHFRHLTLSSNLHRDIPRDLFLFGFPKISRWACTVVRKNTNLLQHQVSTYLKQTYDERPTGRLTRVSCRLERRYERKQTGQGLKREMQFYSEHPSSSACDIALRPIKNIKENKNNSISLSFLCANRYWTDIQSMRGSAYSALREKRIQIGGVVGYK